MKISFISTTTYPSPSWGYGGESSLYALANGLGEIGHEVTLYAAPGSLPPANGRLRYIPGTYGNIHLWAESQVMDQYKEDVLASDLIVDASHNALPAEQIYWYHRPMTKKLIYIPNGVHGHIPRCPRYNVVLGSRKWKELVIYGRSQFYDHPEWSRIWGTSFKPTPEEAIAGVVPWGIPTDFYSPGDKKEDYFLFLSRPTAYKGLGEALWLAAQKKLHLKVVVGIGNASHQNELNSYAPLITKAQEAGGQIEVIVIPQGPHHHEIKREHIRKARGLIAFLTSHEPFGMNIVEALSCGTPVICSTKGSLPDIVDQGKTGFLCETKEGMLEAVDTIGKISSNVCREEAVKRFEARVWAQSILDLPLKEAK